MAPTDGQDRPMNDLLEFAIDAHGGLDRWNSFTRLRAEVSIGGAIWEVKQQPGLLTDKVFDLLTHEERVTISPFTAADRSLEFKPERIVLRTSDGEIAEERPNPRASFEGQI